MIKCSVYGCEKKMFGHGWCNTHYARWRRNGDLVKRRPRGEVHKFINDIAMKYEGEDCLIWPFYRDAEGRGTVYFSGGGRSLASRYVCSLEHGSPPTDKHEAAHSCGNGHGGCVNRKHLRWATPKENAYDKILHGTKLAREKHNMAKINSEIANAIRTLKGKLSQKDIGNLFGISRSAVGKINSGKTWKDPG